MKPLVDELVDQNPLITTTRGFHAVLPCRAAVVPQDPHLRSRDHPPAPDLDRVMLAEAEPRAASAACPGLPAERRDFRRSGRRVLGRHGDGLAVCEPAP